MTPAQLVIAPSLASADIPEHLKQESTDVRHLIIDSFGIDEARQLKEWSATTGYGGSRSFVIAAGAMTGEAQNAILKLLEDPPPATTFYLVVPSASLLLPTLLSRLMKQGRPAAASGELAREFCSMSYKDRLECIASNSKKRPELLLMLFREMEQLSTNTKWPPATKQALLLLQKYMYNRGASKKMLLEELALSLPIEK